MLLERIKAQLVRNEGMRTKPYRCTAGKLTIGVGRNLDDKGITETEALYLLDNDIKDAEADVAHILGAPAATKIMHEHPARYAVLVDMAFNMGRERLYGFKNMLAAVRSGEWVDAAMEMLDSRWAEQVKGRAARLSKQMRTGEWQQ